MGFGVVIVLAIVLSLSSTIIVTNINNRYDNVINVTNKELANLLRVGRAYNEMRLYNLSMAFFAQDRDMVDTLHSNAQAETETTLKYLNDTIEINNSNEMISGEVKEAFNKDFQDLVTGVDVVYRGIIKSTYSAVISNDFEKLNEVVNAGKVNADELNSLLASVLKDVEERAELASSETASMSNASILLLLIIAFFTVLLSIIISLIIGKTIKRPIINISKSVRDVSKGNLDVVLGSNYKDENGQLSNDMASLVNVFNMLISEIKKAIKEIDEGNIDSRIDETKFEGDYRTVAELINYAFSDAMDDTLLVLNYSESIAEGNFNITVKNLPGKKAIMQETMNKLIANLNSVSNDIYKLINSAKAGDFTTKIDTNQYSGDWKKMSEGINSLIETVEAPIDEVAHVLDEVSNANFNVKIMGDYKGKFEEMKNAVNKTVSNISEYIVDISGILNKMADQDLNITINKDYIGDFRTIKDSLVLITNTLNRLISEFSISAEQVSAGAKQISESSMTLAQGATEQATSIEELNGTITSIAKQTSENAKNASKANSLSEETKINDVQGKAEMDQMLGSMSEIEEASSSISKIIKVIEDIAFQTNLLALNAAVEAARAGTHGKGFAVVAEEVGNLASKSSDAAKETTDLINRTITIISNGTKIANSTALSLNEMVDKVSEIALLINEVSQASNQQESSISKINQGIGQISEVTHINTSTSEESASAAQQLASQAEVFKNAISEFVLKKN